jgi:hypothetical protein
MRIMALGHGGCRMEAQLRGFGAIGKGQETFEQHVRCSFAG